MGDKSGKSLDLEKVTAEDFAKVLNSGFQLKLGDQQEELTLVEVEKKEKTELHKREPFILVFEGSEECMISQQIHHLTNETMGEVDLFLVPSGPSAKKEKTFEFHAVFG